MKNLIAIAATLLLTAGGAVAQTYPSKPIRIISPYAPGGQSDVVVRVVMQKVTDSIGQNFVLEPKPGAGGNIAMDYVAKSPPDGYTLVLGTIGPIAINVSLYKKLPFDPVKDLLPITQAANALNVLVVHPSLPAKTVKEVITIAKARPGELSFGSSGPGATDHLAGELFKTLTGVNMVHVPYKGGAPAMLDLMAGQVQTVFSTVSTAIGAIKGGKVRAIAMTGDKRFELMPELPTIAEAGVPGFEVRNWYGVFVPAGTSREIVMRLNGELTKILQMPDVKAKLLESGIEALHGSPEQFAAYIQSETKRWAKVVKDSGARAE